MFDLRVVVLCAFIFLAGFIDSIAGGGGLISLPAYLATGIPTHIALGSNKFSSTCGTCVSSFRYMMGKKIHYTSVFMSGVCALFGAMVGAKVALLVDDSALKIMLIVAVVIVALFVWFKKDFGVKNQVDTLSKGFVVFVSALIGLLLGFYDGFFGPGAGAFIVFAYTFFLKFDLVTASGNAKLINLASNTGALITFLSHGQVDFRLAIPAAFFGILGNFFGSGIALKKGANIIRPVFVVAMVLLLGTVVYGMLR